MRTDVPRPRLWMLLTPWRWPTRTGRLVGYYALTYFVLVITALFSSWPGWFWVLAGLTTAFVLMLAVDFAIFEARLRRARAAQALYLKAVAKLRDGMLTPDDLTPECKEEIDRLTADYRAESPPKEFP